MNIIINAPYIEENNDLVRLCADIEVDAEMHKLYFETEAEYKDFLSPELCDPFLVSLFLFAMEKGNDIICKGSISERLYYQLTDVLMPVITDKLSKYHKIEIKGEVKCLRFYGSAVGTGISCGVDSFYTIYNNLKYKPESELRITHLCFFNAGGNGGMGGELARKVYINRKNRFAEVAKKLNLKFLSCDTNVNEFIKQKHISTHSFRTLAIPLAFQKLFSLYYFASGYDINHFSVSDEGSAHYDLLICPNLSNENIRMVSSGSEASRQKKVEYIAQYDLPRKYLHVCLDNKNTSEVKNCSHCRKCRRTMLNLYLASRLDEFSEVFDTEYFYTNKKEIIKWALQVTIINSSEPDLLEIVDILKSRGEIKPCYYIECYAKLLIQTLYNGIKIIIQGKRNLFT